MNDETKPKGGARSSARLAAVQALYQIESNNSKSVFVIREFLNHRLGQVIDEDQYKNADEAFFEDIVSGASKRSEEIDKFIVESLSEGWTLDRIESVARAVLRAGSYEILARPDVPTNVIINEYVDVTKAFFDDSTPAFVNGVLDRIAKTTR